MAPPDQINNLLTKFDPINLRQRTASAFVLMPIVLLGIYLGGFVYDITVAAVMVLGLHEWLRIVTPQVCRKTRMVAMIGLLVSFALAVCLSLFWGAGVAVVSTLVVLLLARQVTLRVAMWAALGVPYLAIGGLGMMYLRQIPEHGLGLTCFLFVLVWATDIGAYLAGRIIGGPKLCPKISPKKTWAGLLGGMAFAGVFGYAVAEGFAASQPYWAMGLAVVLAGVSQVGDLFESFVKRRYNVKDSGDLIPGHGGILDRIDGLLFAVTGLALFQACFGDGLRWW